MSEKCPLDELDILDKDRVLWDGNKNTDLCIARCVIASFGERGKFVGESYPHPEDFDPEYSDSAIHYGVLWLRPKQRAGFYDRMVDNGNDNIPLEESTSVFVCPLAETSDY